VSEKLERIMLEIRHMMSELKQMNDEQPLPERVKMDLTAATESLYQAHFLLDSAGQRLNEEKQS